MKASVSLYGDYVSLFEEFSRLSDGIVVFNDLAFVGCQINSGTAYTTCHGLGVKPTVGGVSILLEAEVAHGEVSHGGVGAVVRELFDNSISRATIGARDEEVIIPMVFLVSEFPQALVADGDIRRDDAPRKLSPLCTFQNYKLLEFSCLFSIFNVDIVDFSEGRLPSLEFLKKPLDILFISLDYDLYSCVASISHVAY